MRIARAVLTLACLALANSLSSIANAAEAGLDSSQQKTKKIRLRTH
jgi:hypothetical protein